MEEWMVHTLMYNLLFQFQLGAIFLQKDAPAKLGKG